MREEAWFVCFGLSAFKSGICMFPTEIFMRGANFRAEANFIMLLLSCTKKKKKKKPILPTDAKISNWDASSLFTLAQVRRCA